MNFTDFTAEFFSRFGNRSIQPVLFFSPGRVNLIGEHTDYNSGYVLPCALDFGTFMAVRFNDSERINMASMNFDTSHTFTPDSIRQSITGSWTNYPAGVINEFINRGITLKGLDILFTGDIPNGAGLSSSASIEMVTAVAINDLFNAGLETMELVKLSQHAENSFVGMNCGIMDQFAVGFGRENCALFLDCGTLNHEVVPFSPSSYSLIIINTNKRRGLTDSKYNERRSECEKAVEMLQPLRKIDSLTDIRFEEIELLGNYIDNETIFRRARHVISENARVTQAVEALKKGDFLLFGNLMNQSHDSLKNDYEVTGHELDTLVNESRKVEGVIGSRMTGAGFGGCTVSLVESVRVKEFTRRVKDGYTSITGLTPDFYMPGIGTGASRVHQASQ